MDLWAISNIPFQEVPPLQSIWAMDLTPKQFLGSQPTLRIEPSSSRIPLVVEQQEEENEVTPQITSWTYNPNYSRDRRAQLVAQNRLHGRPQYDPESVNSISRRITRLSDDIA